MSSERMRCYAWPRERGFGLWLQSFRSVTPTVRSITFTGTPLEISLRR
jgi:hypothetical protein